MNKITMVAQNPQGVLLTWEKHDQATRYRLEAMSDTFCYYLVNYFDQNTVFIPREELAKSRFYRIHYIKSDEISGQEFSLGTTERFHLEPLSEINLVFLHSYSGGAVSFYADQHFDMYRFYEITDELHLLFETEDCSITSEIIKEGRHYQVEGYKKDEEGNLVLSALSKPYKCEFRTKEQVSAPQLSVVVPVYNCEAFLSRTVDSILLSSFKDLEIILVNDGSSDNSGKVCDWYQEHYSNVRAVHKENGGVSSARNHGMDLSIGEFLAFVDSDDLVHPYMYQKLYNAAEEHGTDIAIGQTIARKDFNQTNLILEVKDIKEDILTYSYNEMMTARGTHKNIYFVSPCNKIVRTKVAKKVRFLNEIPFYEDTAYTSSLYTFIERFTMVKGAYYIWDQRKRQTVGTLTTSTSKYSREIAWVYYFITLLAPLYQGNMVNPTVAEICALNIMKTLLEKYSLNFTKETKEKLIGMIKFYVKNNKIPMEKFNDPKNEKLKKLYDNWLEIKNSDVKECNGWEDILRK